MYIFCASENCNGDQIWKGKHLLKNVYLDILIFELCSLCVQSENVNCISENYICKCRYTHITHVYTNALQSKHT